MPDIAERMGRILPSQTIAITQKARDLRAGGCDIISLSAGEPDFDTPNFIKQAAIDALARGETRYTDVAGTKALREAVAARFRADYGLEYTADEICISTGGKQVIYNVMMATLNKGDEVIIPAPAWVSYPDIVRLADGVPVIIQTTSQSNYCLTAAQLRQAITPRTRWLMLNSPGNPTGSVYREDVLRALAGILLEHPDIRILTDDIYGKLVYDNIEAKTILQVAPQLRSRVVVMNGVSKAYAMTGWRIGFSAAPKDLTQQLVKLQGQITSNACSIAQAAACAALEGPQDYVEMMRRTYQHRRDLVMARLAEIPGLFCHKPGGAFYIFVSVAAFMGKTSSGGVVLKNDEDFVTALLDETGVATVHGTAFLTPGYFRLSYATSDALLEEACQRIARFCKAIH